MFVSGCDTLPWPRLHSTPTLPVPHGTSVSVKCKRGILVGPRLVGCDNGVFRAEGAGVPECKGIELLGGFIV